MQWPERDYLPWYAVIGLQSGTTYPTLSFQVIEDWLQLCHPHVRAASQSSAIQTPAGFNKIPEDLIQLGLRGKCH